MQKLKNYFYDKYIKRSLQERINLARTYYNRLKSQYGSDAFELLCVLSGANGGVTQRKYELLIALTNDRGSIGMFTSLVNSMYTSYTVERVCKNFSRDNAAMEGAVNILFLFASLNGSLSSDDERMMRYITNF